MEDLPFELYSQNTKGIGAKNFDVPFAKRHLYLPKRELFDKVVSKLHLRELLGRYDLMHIPHNFDNIAHPEKCIVTIHDAMFFSYPEAAFNPEFARRYYRVSECKAIITCSESSKHDIVKYMNVPEDKVNVAIGDNDVVFPKGETI